MGLVGLVMLGIGWGRWGGGSEAEAGWFKSWNATPAEEKPVMLEGKLLFLFSVGLKVEISIESPRGVPAI